MIGGMRLRRRTDQEAPRRRRRLVIGGGVGLPLAVLVWSFGSYVFVDNGDTMQQRAVTWGRDHHLGGLVDLLERKRYSSPPSKHAATNLGVKRDTPPGRSAGSPSPTMSAPAGPGGVVANGNAAIDVASESGQPPAPLTPAVTPPLPGEGAWQVIGSAGGV